MKYVVIETAHNRFHLAKHIKARDGILVYRLEDQQFSGVDNAVNLAQTLTVKK